jgi:hypothetical protein
MSQPCESMEAVTLPDTKTRKSAPESAMSRSSTSGSSARCRSEGITAEKKASRASREISIRARSTRDELIAGTTGPPSPVPPVPPVVVLPSVFMPVVPVLVPPAGSSIPPGGVSVDSGRLTSLSIRSLPAADGSDDTEVAALPALTLALALLGLTLSHSAAVDGERASDAELPAPPGSLSSSSNTSCDSGLGGDRPTSADTPSAAVTRARARAAAADCFRSPEEACALLSPPPLLPLLLLPGERTDDGLSATTERANRAANSSETVLVSMVSERAPPSALVSTRGSALTSALLSLSLAASPPPSLAISASERSRQKNLSRA